MSDLDKGLGWVPDLPDFRDYKFSVAATAPVAAASDLTSLLPSPYDQQQLGSCVWNAAAGAWQFDEAKQGLPVTMPSRLFGYWLTRQMEGSVGYDSGCQIRDAMKVMATFGVCPEETWPYVTDRFINQPSQECYDQAIQHKSLVYESIIQDQNDILAALSSGYPVIHGISVYESFMSAASRPGDGVIPMPQSNESMLGGHAMLMVGHDIGKRLVKDRNSWGDKAGDKGHIWLPFDFVFNPDLASDFWVLRTVE